MKCRNTKMYKLLKLNLTHFCKFRISYLSNMENQSNRPKNVISSVHKLQRGITWHRNLRRGSFETGSSIQKLHLRSRQVAPLLEPSKQQKEKEVPQRSSFLPLRKCLKKSRGFSKVSRRGVHMRSLLHVAPFNPPRWNAYSNLAHIRGFLIAMQKMGDFLGIKFFRGWQRPYEENHRRVWSPRNPLAVVESFAAQVLVKTQSELFPEPSWSSSLIFPSGRWACFTGEESLLVTRSFHFNERLLSHEYGDMTDSSGLISNDILTLVTEKSSLFLWKCDLLSLNCENAYNVEFRDTNFVQRCFNLYKITGKNGFDGDNIRLKFVFVRADWY